MTARAKTNYKRVQEYLSQFDIDAGAVARTGLSPEGYYTPNGRIRAKGLNQWESEADFVPWPAGFDYEEFGKRMWQDEFGEVIE